MTHNTPPILLFFILLTYKLLDHFYSEKADVEKDENLIEGLVSYEYALGLEDKKQMLCTEEYYSKKYGVKYYSDETIEKFKASVDDETEQERQFQAQAIANGFKETDAYKNSIENKRNQLNHLLETEDVLEEVRNKEVWNLLESEFKIQDCASYRVLDNMDYAQIF